MFIYLNIYIYIYIYIYIFIYIYICVCVCVCVFLYTVNSPYLLVFGDDRAMRYTRADDVAGGTGRGVNLAQPTGFGPGPCGRGPKKLTLKKSPQQRSPQGQKPYKSPVDHTLPLPPLAARLTAMAAGFFFFSGDDAPARWRDAVVDGGKAVDARCS